MQSSLGLIALVCALAALALVGMLMLEQRGPAPGEMADRIQSLEDQVADLERARQERRSLSEAPELAVRDGGLSLSLPSPADAEPAAPGTEHASADRPAQDRPTQDRADEESPTGPGEIEELVNKAVEKKAAQMRAMRNKKPAIDVFASTLELTEDQREEAAREVVRGQQEIHDLLQIPAEDGTVFLDELVEVLAYGVAKPGQNGPMWQKLLGRLMSEKVPGSDQTYVQQAEAVKQTVRDTFRRNWTEQQYARFEAWQMDPTEVKGIAGSPWKRIEGRVLERARDLGAALPSER